MFGNKESKDHKISKGGDAGASVSGSGGGVNTIDKNTTIEGNLRAGGDIRIDGKMIGDIDCEAKLIIGKSGVVDGTVKCLNAVIEGTFTGDLTVREKLDLMSTARVDGEVRAKKMFADSGCELKGTCQVTGNLEPKPAASSNGSANPLKREKAGVKA